MLMNCPHCQAELEMPESATPQHGVTCPVCGAGFLVAGELCFPYGRDVSADPAKKKIACPHCNQRYDLSELEPANGMIGCVDCGTIFAVPPAMPADGSPAEVPAEPAASFAPPPPPPPASTAPIINREAVDAKLAEAKEAAGKLGRAAAGKADELYNRLPLDKINAKLGGKVDVKSKKFKIILASALALLLIVIGFLCFGGNSPKSVARKFQKALIKGDLKTAESYFYGNFNRAYDNARENCFYDNYRGDDRWEKYRGDKKFVDGFFIKSLKDQDFDDVEIKDLEESFDWDKIARVRSRNYVLELGHNKEKGKWIIGSFKYRDKETPRW